MVLGLCDMHITQSLLLQVFQQT